MAKQFPLVSIIFPNHNGGKQPLECIVSIAKLNYPKQKLEVIIVDNNSTDGSREKLKVQSSKLKVEGQKIKIIENKENMGFAKAINQGIKHSSGKYIFIGNDDLTFEKNSIETLIEYAQTHPKVGILGGKIFLKNKPKKTVSAGYMMNPWTGNVYVSAYSHKIHEPDWVQGCAMLIRKSLLARIGFLDDNFSLIYFEDFDLCIRARRNGFKVVYLPDATFWHSEAATMNKDKSHKYYQWYKNKIRFCLKHFPYLNILTILSMQFFLVTPYRALVLRDGRLIPSLKGLFWNIAHLPQTVEARKKLYELS